MIFDHKTYDHFAKMYSHSVLLFDEFFHSDEKLRRITIEKSGDRVLLRNYGKNFSNPRVVVRTIYKAELLIECDTCGNFNNIDSMKSEWSDEMASGVFNTFENASALASDMDVRCEICHDTISFSNEIDCLKEYKRDGRVVFGEWKATDEVLLLKEPFKYPTMDWGYCCRKHYRN